MPVQYVRVRSTVDQFSPSARPTGVVAIIGAAPSGSENVPVQVTTPAEAASIFGPAFQDSGTTVNSALTRAIQTAFRQSPGPSQVWGVRSGNDLATAFATVETLDANLVVVANAPLGGPTAAAIAQLSEHVTSVSSGGDGKERMGVAMLPKDSSDPTVVAGALANDRMVYVAHRCKDEDGDPAAAVAGTIAGYPPHVSMVLKQVSIASAPFTSAQIDQLNKTEEFDAPPQGRGVNWLTHPALIPGQGIYLGEGYTGNPGGMKFIDVQRTVDDISFKIKARLIALIGAVRMSRTGLRALSLQVETVLSQLAADGVIDGFDVTIPVLDLLDADPATLTPVQLQRIKNAQDSRLAQLLVSVDYNGAAHRIAVDLTVL